MTHHHPTRRCIATLALESPFYGQRKPHYQQGSKLLHVSDLLLLGHWDDVGDSLGVLPPLALLQAVSVKPLEVGMGV